MTVSLSPLEATKQRMHNPYAMRDEVLARVARGTAADISPEDDIVMRWHGLYRHRPSEGEVYMLRFKLPGGVITAEQFALAGELAERIGSGRVSLTTRQCLEIHGMKLADLPAVFSALDEAGVTTVGSCGDQVRNIVSCPVAGIDSHELFDTTATSKALVAAFLGNPLFANLPRKFKIALSGCACGCVPYDINDLALVAVRGAGDAFGYAALIGGGLSAQPTHASSLGVWISQDETVEVVTRLVELFRDEGNRSNRGRARVKHLIAERGVAWVREELIRRLGRPLPPYELPVPAPSRQDHLGVHPQREEGRVYFGIPVPAGQLSSSQVRLLADIAQTHGRGRIRLTHLQNVILPDIPVAQEAAIRSQLQECGLSVSAESRYGRVVSCTGKMYCMKSVTHTRERVQPLAEAIDDPLLGGAVSLRISGCPNGCGGHAVADIGLRGAAVRTEAGLEERFDVLVGGGEAPEPAFAECIASRQHPDELAGIITALLQRYRCEARNGETFSAYARRVLWPER